MKGLLHWCFLYRVFVPLCGHVLLLVVGVLLPLRVNAQIVNGEAFLQGNYTEVGVRAEGTFGTTADAPGVFHPRPGGTGQNLGFVVDRDKDGWTNGSPAYDGDFFLPGSPAEGWSVYLDGASYSNATHTADEISGSLANFTSNQNKQSVEWSGTINGLQIDKIISVAASELGISIAVRLTNTTGTDMTNVYYGRSVDPDNNKSIGQSYSTTNTIESQPPTDSLARVSAAQPDGSYVALAATSNLARVTHGGSLYVDNPHSIWNGSSPLHSSGSVTADQAISLAFKFETIAAGESVSFSYRYLLSDTPLDYGDAPASYHTLAGDNGPNHDVSSPTLYLGSTVDAESDGFDSEGLGDDSDGTDDEDGVQFTGALSPDATIDVEVTSSASGTLNAWIDFLGDGDFDDSEDQIFSDVSVSSGANSLSFSVPTTARGGTTYARFRLNSGGGINATGPATEGEVEDYQVSIKAPQVTLASDTSSVSENGGKATVTASLSYEANASVVVSLAATGTAAGGGVDYSLDSSAITIPAGSIAGSVSLTAVDNAEAGAAKAVILSITSVTNATESGEQKASITIFDDDATPTPTPSNTPTVTPTFSPTTTSTPTLTPIPTSTPTATPSSTPTAVPTPTWTSAPTPTFPVTPVPTATPTSAAAEPDEVEVVIVVDGQPLKDALVYFPDAGTCITNSEGSCTVSGLSQGRRYRAFVQKSGVSFAVSEFDVGAGQSVTVTGTEQEYNPMNCRAKDQTVKLHSAAQRVKQVNAMAAADFNRLRPSAMVRLPGGVQVSALSLLNRVERQFIDYIGHSRALPEVPIDCSAVSACAVERYDDQKRSMLRALGDMRREALLANRLMRQRSVRGRLRSKRRKRIIYRRAKRARAKIRRLIAWTGICIDSSFRE